MTITSEHKSDRDLFIDWFINNKALLNHEIQELDWGNVNKKFYDINVTINKNGKHSGRGTHENPMNALSIAIGESLERYICHYNHLSTNGVAVHFNQELAQKNATQELIERHSVLFHIKNSIPFFRVDYMPNHLLSHNQEIELGFFKTLAINGQETFIIRGKVKENNGFVYSSSSALNEYEEMKYLRKYIGLKQHGFQALDQNQKNCLVDPKYSFNNLFEEQNTQLEINEGFNILTSNLKSDLEFPAFCVRAESSLALSLEDGIENFIG